MRVALFVGWFWVEREGMAGSERAGAARHELPSGAFGDAAT